MGRGLLATTVVVVALALNATVALALDTGTEAQNFGKGSERSAIYNTPEYRALLTQISVQNSLEATGNQAARPERSFRAQLGASGESGRAGDPPLYDWDAKAYGISKKVLCPAPNGAT